MKLLNGSRIALNMKAVEKATKLGDADQAVAGLVPMLKDNNACWVVFGEDDQEVARIRQQDNRQAITAATDFLLYDKYNHPLTGESLHIRTGVNMEADLIEDIGVIRSSYVGPFMPAPDMVDGQHVWHQLGIRLGNVYSRPIPKSYAKTRSAKHDFIEYLIRGYALHVWVAPIREYIAPFIYQWLIGDMEKAQAYRTQRLTASQINKREIRPAGYAAYKAVEGAKELGEEVTLPTEIFVESITGEAINLMDLKASTGIQLYRGNDETMLKLNRMQWVPEDPVRVLTFADMFSEPDNYKVEVLQ